MQTVSNNDESVTAAPEDDHDWIAVVAACESAERVFLSRILAVDDGPAWFLEARRG